MNPEKKHGRTELQNYIRVKGILYLTAAQLQKQSFEELMFEVYDEEPNMHTSFHSKFKGFSEWVSNTVPNLSMGWDWSVKEENMVMEGQPYKNFAVIDEQGNVLPQQEDIQIVTKLISELSWERGSEKYGNNNLH